MKRSFRRSLDGTDADAWVWHGQGTTPGTGAAHPSQQWSKRDLVVLLRDMDIQAVIWREFPGDGLAGLQVAEELPMAPARVTSRALVFNGCSRTFHPAGELSDRLLLLLVLSAASATACASQHAMQAISTYPVAHCASG